MRSASSGLRHPASASCLGRHSRLAGRCPNNSSLFPPLAAVVVVAAEKLFYNFGIPECLRTLRYSIFTGGVVETNGRCSACFHAETGMRRGRCGTAVNITLSVIAARCQLPRGGSFICADWKMRKSSPFGGAGKAVKALPERVKKAGQKRPQTFLTHK